MNNPVIACTNLSKTFVEGDLKTPVLSGVNLTVEAGKSIAIVGASGSGKSTLLHLLGGLDSPSSGSVSWFDTDISTLSEKKKCQLRNKHLGFVYQFHHLLPEFDTIENVMMPLLIRKENVTTSREHARKLLDMVGLTHRLHHKVTQLSGGERQRVALARALVTNPNCVLADEPTGNLDQRTASTVFDVMLNLQEELKTSYIIVTHDIDLAARMQIQYTLTDGNLAQKDVICDE